MPRLSLWRSPRIDSAPARGGVRLDASKPKTGCNKTKFFLAPKREYVFSVVGTARCAVRAAFSGASTRSRRLSARNPFRPLDAGGDAAARRPYLIAFKR